MTEPPGKKELWKNIGWRDKDSKLAFFNKYFRNTSILNEYVDFKTNEIKERLLEFAQQKTIKEGGKERPVTIKDIIEEIKG